MGAPVRCQKAVSRSKETAAAKRRKARRSALWIGGSLPLKGQAQPQGGHRVRRSAPAPIGALPPRCGGFPPNGGRAPVTPERWRMPGRTRAKPAPRVLRFHATAGPIKAPAPGEEAMTPNLLRTLVPLVAAALLFTTHASAQSQQPRPIPTFPVAAAGPKGP